MHPRTDRHELHRRTLDDGRRRPMQGFRTHGRVRFERLVDQALDLLPDAVLEHVENVALVIEEVPPDDEVLLGLYEGVPRTERDHWAPPLPDTITLYRRPLEARARTRQELLDSIVVTLVHEIAHHLGIDDDRLDDLGWA